MKRGQFIYNREEIISLRKEGLTYKEIKEKLGCGTFTIWTVLKEEEGILNVSWKENRPKKEKTNRKYPYKSKAGKRSRNRIIVDEYLEEHPCVDCGNSDIRVLDFDHVRGKKLGHVSVGVRQAWKLDRLYEEMSKCEIRCSNCHRIVTWERRNKNQLN